MLRVQAHKFGDVTILCVQGKIVVGEIATLCNVVLAQSHVRTVVLDFSRVTRIDAGGLGALLEMRERMQSRGISLRLMNASKLVRQVLEITCLSSVFEISPEVKISGAVPRSLPASAFRAPCFQKA